MFGFGGLGEIAFLLFLAMLIFGPQKMPEIARMLAKGMAEVRKASNELKRTLNAELAISEQEAEERRRAALPVPPKAPPPSTLSTESPVFPAPPVAALASPETTAGELSASVEPPPATEHATSSATTEEPAPPADPGLGSTPELAPLVPYGQGRGSQSDPSEVDAH
jgi:Sec-independent protein translocase protein TatA